MTTTLRAGALVLGLLGIFIGAPAASAADPTGTWVTENGRSHVRVTNCGGALCGSIIWLKEPNDPATGKPLASISQADEADVHAAVRAATSAQEGWLGIGGHARARYLYAIARHIQRQSRLLAVLETLDNGKPIRETRDIDIPLVARHFYYHAGWAQLMASELPGYEPVGVCGQIIPWNFPLAMITRKVAPALPAPAQ